MIAFYNKAILECESINDKTNEIKDVLESAYYNMAIYSFDYTKAEVNYLKSIHYNQNLPDIKILSICRIGELNYRTLKYKTAVEYFSEGIRLIAGLIESKTEELNDENSIKIFFKNLKIFLFEHQHKTELRFHFENYFIAVFMIVYKFIITKDYELGFLYISQWKHLYFQLENSSIEFDGLLMGLSVSLFHIKDENSVYFIDKAVKLFSTTRLGPKLLLEKSRHLDQIQAEDCLHSALKQVNEIKEPINYLHLIYCELGFLKIKTKQTAEAITYFKLAKKALGMPEFRVFIDDNRNTVEELFTGQCLIVNNIDSVDSNEVKTFFEKMNYKVIIKNNINYYEFIGEVNKISESERLSSFITILITEGNKSKLLFPDDEEENSEEILIENLILLFDNTLMENLIKVKKIVFLLTFSEAEIQRSTHLSSEERVECINNYCPFTDICIWSIHYNHKQSINLDIIKQFIDQNSEDKELHLKIKNIVSIIF